MKDNIKDENEIWTTGCYPEKKWNGIKEENSDGETEAFLVGIYDNTTLFLFDIKILGDSDSSNLG